MTSQKSIVLLPYPFTDLRSSKVRPALVISNDKFNNTTEDRIMVPLTTVLKTSPYSIFITQKDMETGLLIRPSKIKADTIFTVENSLILKSIGTISNNSFEEVKEQVLNVI